MIPKHSYRRAECRQSDRDFSDQLTEICRDAFERAARFLGSSELREVARRFPAVAPDNLVARYFTSERRGFSNAGVQLTGVEWIAGDGWRREIMVSVATTPTNVVVSAIVVDPSQEEAAALLQAFGDSGRWVPNDEPGVA